jgi:5-deoxy-glucuronate isomerase
VSAFVEKLGVVVPAGTGGDGTYALAITPERAGWAHSSLNVLELAAGGTHTFNTGEDEWVVLPLIGSCSVACDGAVLALAGRRGVFTRVTDFAYVPRDATATVSSEEGGRFALCGARATRRLTARYGPAEGVQVELRGAGQASRQVNNFCTPATFEADRLIAVEVITPGGNWSSFPPHKHDEKGPNESRLEEVYYFEATRVPAATSGSTAPGRARRSTSAPRCAPATRSSSRTAGTARRWPRPATTSTTSTSWPARTPTAPGRSATTPRTPGSAECGRASRSTPGFL